MEDKEKKQLLEKMKALQRRVKELEKSKSERKKVEEALSRREDILNESQRVGHIGSWELDIVSNTLTWSDETYRLFDLEPQQFEATYEAFLDNIHPDDREIVDKAYTESIRTKTPYDIVHRLLLKDGTIKCVNERCETFFDGDGKPIRSIGVVHDITERKQEEKNRELMIKLLQYLNEPGELVNIIRKVLKAMQEYTGLEVVALRLQEGEDYPYFVQYGFSDEFVQGENFLCERDKAGELVRDFTGSPALDCMCGNIIRGRTDPKLPFFTKGGSFWSNCTTELLATTTEKERQARTRNRCNSEGYESVALIPIRTSVGIIGLIQLNDRRKDSFNLEFIRSLEAIAITIGSAFERKKWEEKIKDVAKEWKNTFDSISDLIFIQDKEHTILKVNKAFANVLKMDPSDIIGKKCYELLHKSSGPYPGGPFEKTIKDKKAYTEEINDPNIGVPLLISTSPIFSEKGEVIGSVHLAKDITERKKFEKGIIERTKKLKVLNKKLYELANTDPLTKISNRRFFFITAKKKFDEAKHKKRLLSAIMFDIDHFKDINDTHGHDAGDVVLCKIANRVSSVLTEKSVFGRIGGEEFAIATSDINDEDTLKLAEKIRHVIGDKPIKIDSEELNITVSLGVTNYKHQNTIDELMKECDDLMYKAKDEGRNRVRSNIRSLPRKRLINREA